MWKKLGMWLLRAVIEQVVNEMHQKSAKAARSTQK